MHMSTMYEHEHEHEHEHIFALQEILLDAGFRAQDSGDGSTRRLQDPMHERANGEMHEEMHGDGGTANGGGSAGSAMLGPISAMGSDGMGSEAMGTDGTSSHQLLRMLQEQGAVVAKQQAALDRMQEQLAELQKHASSFAER